MLGKSLDPISPHLRSLDVKDDVIRDENLSEIIANMISPFFDAEFGTVKKAIAQVNGALSELLLVIKRNLLKVDISSLKQSIDLPDVFDLLLNECTESDAVLEILYELISRENLPPIKKVVDKYHHNVSLNTWQDTWKTNNTIMEKYLDKKINLEISLYLATMGFSVTIDILRRFVDTNDEATTHSLISAGAINQFDQTKMQGIFNTFLRKAHISNAEAVRQLMIQKGYKFELILETNSTTCISKPLLMRVKLSKLYDVIKYAVQHCKSFNLIKNAHFEEDEVHNKYLPETVLSYLAFVKQLDAMKLIIENPDCSFTPSHLVACSLFRGHHISRYFKLSLPIYDEIFDYLMRDDIRLRVLGDDKVWIDKSIFIAIRYGNERMVKKLVDLGADLTNIFITSRHYQYRSTYARYSLLSYACEYQTISLVEFLIEKGIPVDGTMIDALGEPMIEMEDTIMNDNDKLNDDDNDNDDGDDEADVNKVGDESDFDIKHKFYFSSDKFGEIEKSLYPQYFHIPKVNRNHDIPRPFDYRKCESESVHLLNMTPLGVAVYRQKVDIAKLLLFHGANPMGKCMINFPALFCLSNIDVAYAFSYDEYESECTDEEIELRYPLKENKENMTIKRSINKYGLIERPIEPHHSHFTTILSETIRCVNIKTFLAEYSHKLECGLHESGMTGPKRQRRGGLDSVEIVNEVGNDYTGNYKDENEAEDLASTNKDLIVDIPVQTTTTVATRPSPHTSQFIYRNNIPKLFQLLIDYGAPAEFDGKKFGATIPIERYSSNDEFSIESLLNLNNNHAGYGADLIIFFAKHNMISLEKFDELINLCFCKAKTGPNTEKMMNVCELLSAIIYPTTDNLIKGTTLLSSFDQKVALTSGILDSGYSDKLFDVAMDKIYGSYHSNIEVFMRLTRAYPRFFYLNMQHSSGKSLLHNNDVVLAYNLVQLGFDVNYCTPLGDSLLLQTIKNVNTDNIELIHRLVMFGADINKVGLDDVNCEQAMNRSSYPQSLKDFMKRCARIMELLNIMNQYQNEKCVCLQRDDNRTSYTHAGNIGRSSRSASLSIAPFSEDDYDLLASSGVPEYTYDTLSYFFSACSSNCTPDVCVGCEETLSKNDHCRPYQTIPSEDENCLPTSTYIHDECFFLDLDMMVVNSNVTSMETGFPQYIRNPTKKYNAPHI